MIASDASTLIAYIQEENRADVDRLDAGLADGTIPSARRLERDSFGAAATSRLLRTSVLTVRQSSPASSELSANDDSCGSLVAMTAFSPGGQQSLSTGVRSSPL